MASKNLTHIYMIMRDKAIQRRNMYKREEGFSDRDALVQCDELECGLIGLEADHLPEWTGQVEEVHYNISILKDKTKILAALHSNLLRRPSLDENTDEEKQLISLTNEIRRTIERCQSLMLQIRRGGTLNREHTLNTNVVRSLAFNLSEVKNEFLRACSSYNSSMNNIKKTSSFINETADENAYGTFDEFSISQQSRDWNQEQVLFLEDNTVMVEERDRAVQNIVRSTIQLNQLFRDVAQLVHDQGTILDRIDFNIEHSAVKVEDGVKQLRKAEEYQSKNRNMKCILCLTAATIFMIILLILVKS